MERKSIVGVLIVFSPDVEITLYEKKDRTSIKKNPFFPSQIFLPVNKLRKKENNRIIYNNFYISKDSEFNFKKEGSPNLFLEGNLIQINEVFFNKRVLSFLFLYFNIKENDFYHYNDLKKYMYENWFDLWKKRSNIEFIIGFDFKDTRDIYFKPTALSQQIFRLFEELSDKKTMKDYYFSFQVNEFIAEIKTEKQDYSEAFGNGFLYGELIFKETFLQWMEYKWRPFKLTLKISLIRMVLSFSMKSRLLKSFTISRFIMLLMLFYSISSYERQKRLSNNPDKKIHKRKLKNIFVSLWKKVCFVTIFLFGHYFTSHDSFNYTFFSDAISKIKGFSNEIFTSIPKTSAEEKAESSLLERWNRFREIIRLYQYIILPILATGLITLIVNENVNKKIPILKITKNLISLQNIFPSFVKDIILIFLLLLISIFLSFVFFVCLTYFLMLLYFLIKEGYSLLKRFFICLWLEEYGIHDKL